MLAELSRRSLPVLLAFGWLAVTFVLAGDLELKLNLDPIKYEFSGPGFTDEALELAGPDLGQPKNVGLDSLLERIASARGGFKTLARHFLGMHGETSDQDWTQPRRLVLGAFSSLGLDFMPKIPSQPQAETFMDQAPQLPSSGLLSNMALSRKNDRPARLDADSFRFTTNLGPLGRTYGEFTAKDWSDLGSLGELTPSDTRFRATPETPGREACDSRPVDRKAEGNPPKPVPSVATAINRARPKEGASNPSRVDLTDEGGLLVLPSFDGSGFQIGPTFSLSGRGGLGAGFIRQDSALKTDLKSPTFGLQSSYRTPDGLRLNATYERELPQDPKAVKPANRLWTGVLFNF